MLSKKKKCILYIYNKPRKNHSKDIDKQNCTVQIKHRDLQTARLIQKIMKTIIFLYTY